MRLPRHFVPRNDGTVKNQIPLTPFSKGGDSFLNELFSSSSSAAMQREGLS
jgi:hypothetical protein